jgi:hypothetical protein
MSLLHQLHAEHIARRKRIEAVAAAHVPKPPRTFDVDVTKPRTLPAEPVLVALTKLGPLRIMSIEECVSVSGRLVDDFVPLRTDELLQQIMLGRCMRLGGVGVRQIQREVCRFYQIRFDELLCTRRTNDIIWPRHVSRFLSRHLTLKSMPELGRLHGGIDHTTILNSERQVMKAISCDPRRRDEIQIIIMRLLEHCHGSYSGSVEAPGSVWGVSEADHGRACGTGGGVVRGAFGSQASAQGARPVSGEGQPDCG